MKILSIETSCDETALAIVEANGELDSPEFSILNTALNSQVEKHREFGGVFPALAKREHAKNLVPLLDQVLSPFQRDPEKISGRRQEGVMNWSEIEKILEREPELFEKLKNFVETHEKPFDYAHDKPFDYAHDKPLIDMIAVTSGPGLEPALWVGINFARALSLIWNIPLLPVNHMEGHIASVLLSQNLSKSEISNPKSETNSKLQTNHKNYKLKATNYRSCLISFPALALLISGGHTEIILVSNWGEYKKIGNTLDDAVGEAYDKVARMLDLPYPGGPEISRLAKQAREDPRLREDDRDDEIVFPRPMINSKDLNFSLSGLKTAVLYKIQKLESENESRELSDIQKKIISKEFEQAVVDVLISKTRQAIKDNLVSTLIVGGGVIANEYIRESLEKLGAEENIEVFFPTKEHSTDNAVMIASAGYLKSFREKAEICPDIKANGNLSF